MNAHEPTEEQIAKVLEKYTPRQIAIAYLRATHRAKSAKPDRPAPDAIDEMFGGWAKIFGGEK